MSSINAKMKAEKRAMDKNDQKLIQRTIDEGIETVWSRPSKNSCRNAGTVLWAFAAIVV